MLCSSNIHLTGIQDSKRQQDIAVTFKKTYITLIAAKQTLKKMWLTKTKAIKADIKTIETSLTSA